MSQANLNGQPQTQPTGRQSSIANFFSGSSSRRNTMTGGATPDGMKKKKADDRWFKRAQGVLSHDVNEKGRTVGYATTSNNVITSKYTVITFFPRNLFEQFQNLANLYFLFVGILQLIGPISTTGGFPSQWEPLGFIVAVSAIRAAKEDYDKHMSDSKRNGFKYLVSRPSGLHNTESGDIRVGDIVKVKQNDMIPADMLFLGSALPKGHCFIDKSNLNGETTLEVMSSIAMTRDICRNDTDTINMHIQLVYEAPNKKFDSFRGNMWIENETLRTEVGVDGKALLMRETNLRNCEYVYGLVVYTGNDTKIQRSNLEGEKVKIKVSRVMRQVNTLLQYMVTAQLALCLIGGILAGAYCSSTGLSTYNAWYLRLDDGDNSFSCPVTGILAFFSWFILLCQMVPISLIVSSELVKFAQSIFISWDLSMYHAPIDKATKCNSSTIHEDLGVIDYIFSDKTGTLTQNKMEFRYIAVPSGEYGSKETEIAKGVKARQQELEEKLSGNAQLKDVPKWSKLSKPFEAKASRKQKERLKVCCKAWPWFSQTFWDAPHEEEEDEGNGEGDQANVNTFTAEETQQLLKSLWGHDYPHETPEKAKARKDELRLYMTHMALSNTVKPFEEKGEMKFQAESAEELAMANFARAMGFFKKSINPTVLEVTEYSQDLKTKKVVTEGYNHVATFGFTSKRARVTVIYQIVGGPRDKQILTMTKGQDTVIIPLIKIDPSIEQDLLLNLKDMSTYGLRTLVAAHSTKPAEWWNTIAPQYTDIVSRDSTPNSEGHPDKCKKDLCEKCASHDFFEKIEKDAELQYCGCIGMEDLLAVLVPQTIADFARAGLKVMMITGDKLETAKNIGLACNLIDADMMPRLRATESLDQIVEEYQNSRLLEITGQWASLAEDKEQMGRLFDSFATEEKGQLSLVELQFILKSLRCTIPDEKLRELLQLESGASGSNSIVRKDKFVDIMQSTRLSKYEAVKYDIEQAIETYNRIQDHVTYPVSILIDRGAWLVLYPGKPAIGGGTLIPGMKKEEAKIPTLPSSTTFTGSVHGPDYQPTEEELEALRAKFFKLLERSKSVVFARAEPAMKKKMVTEAQARLPHAITLAVGDGANDQDMIMAAHVGVGIAGVEGTAATNSADYAIGSFRYLHTLIFVHGFYSYQRVSKLVNFIFYKAALCSLTMFLFGFYSAFSAQEFFDDPSYEVYNVMYTALPIMFVAVLDKALPQNVLQDNPIIYKKTKNTAFTGPVFASWILRSACHTTIMFFICLASVGISDVNNGQGRNDGIWYWASVNYYSVVVCPTLMIIFEMNSINFLAFLSLFISIFCLIVVDLIIDALLFVDPNLYGIILEMYHSGAAFFTVILAVSICILLELTWRALQREYSPHLWQIYQEKLKFSSSSQLIDDAPTTAPLTAQASKLHLPIPSDTRENSVVGRGGDSGKFSHHIRLNLVRAMLRFRNMTGASFDSAAQTHLQHHDQYTDETGKVHGAINVVSPEYYNKNVLSQMVNEGGAWKEQLLQPQSLPNMGTGNLIEPPNLRDKGLVVGSMPVSGAGQGSRLLFSKEEVKQDDRKYS